MPTPPSHLRRILVVDDEPGLRNLLQKFFTRHGYDVRTVADGPAALAVLPTFQPQVVLLDVRMPGMSGMEVLARLHQEQPAIHVIMITAFDDEVIQEEARRLGAVDYLTKPFNLEYLSNTVLPKLAALAQTAEKSPEGTPQG